MRLVTKGVRSDLEQDFGGVRVGLSRRPKLIHVKIASDFEKPHKRFLSSAVRPAVMVERPLQLNSEFQPARLETTECSSTVVRCKAIYFTISAFGQGSGS